MSGKVDFAELCNKVSLTELATRAGVKLHRAGRDMMGCCPFHNESTPSFSIFRGNDRERFKCFGCSASGDAVRFVEMYQGCDTKEAIRILGGLEPMRSGVDTKRPQERKNDEQEIAKAQQIYKKARPAAGTVVETYLRQVRGIDLDRIGGVPESLRFDMIKYWRHVRGEDKPVCLGEFPCMVAPIQQADGSVTAVHITYLDSQTCNKVMLQDPNNTNKRLPPKKIRGIKTAGSIRLGHGAGRLMMSEGIETVLAAKTALVGTPADAPAWTCVDLDNFGAMRLPLYVTNILFLADNDMQVPRTPEERNTRNTLLEAARRHSQRGCRIKMAFALNNSDFNDMLNGTGIN